LEDRLRIFTEALAEATRNIGERYFRLAVAGSPIPMVRERVYCYELYHQLRLCLPSDQTFPYTLHGEVDKSKHPFIYELIGRKIPDFIVHIPGLMGRDANLVVVEVKPCGVDIETIEKDIITLRQFLEEAEYYAAISLVYGEDKEALVRHIQEGFRGHGDLKERLRVYWHSNVAEPAQMFDWWEYL
jgi:hypothetical protein